MAVNRRQFLLAGGVTLVSCRNSARPPLLTRPSTTLDVLLAAHAEALPENSGGANHYPMAAEALVALGHEDAIEDSWIRGAAIYAGESPPIKPIEDGAEALGSYERFGDWLDYFRDAMRRDPWRQVLARWAPRLAPGISAAAFHGVIRTGHAARALREHESDSRRNELAVGLAYWAARYAELPVSQEEEEIAPSLGQALKRLHHPWLHDRSDVGFHHVGDRLTQAKQPVAPPALLGDSGSSVAGDLRELVREAAAGVLEMLVLKRNRLWLMHTVTGPAAVELLLPDVDQDGARRLVAYARQAVVAMFGAYGEPFQSGDHTRTSVQPWPTLIQRAVATRSVHTIKLIEALHRFDSGGDLRYRSTAAQWLEWV